MSNEIQNSEGAPAGEENTADGGDELTQVKTQLAQALEEADKQKDALLRTAAEFENFRKRQRREMDETRKYAAEKVLLELIPVLDNLERALAVAPQDLPKDQAGLVTGVKMVAAQFRGVLEGQGVKPFVSVGQAFDPTKHEAISEKEHAGSAPGTVLEEFQRGYMLHDRVIRPAMVVVAKAGGDAEKPPDVLN